MKKIIILITTILVILQTANAQYKPILKTKILFDSLKGAKSKIVIYEIYSSKITSKDSVNPETKQIIHFEPQDVQVEQIYDTIIIDSLYKKMEESIINCYFCPTKDAISFKETSNTKTSYFGFWKETTTKIDSLKFLYENVSKNMFVNPSSGQKESKHVDYWLIGAWILLFWINRNLSKTKRNKPNLFKSMIEFWGKAELIIIWQLILVLISLLIIIFSKSIIILILIITIPAIIEWYKKKTNIFYTQEKINKLRKER